MKKKFVFYQSMLKGTVFAFMAVFMFVTNGNTSAALLDDKCIGSGVSKIAASAEVGEGAKVCVEISDVCRFKFEDKERFYELASRIAGIELKDATPVT